MKKKCVCGCDENFKVNEAHPGILYKKGHRPKPQKIPCRCGCGTMIWNVGKRGLPVKFVNGHASRVRREEIARVFKEHRAIPENTLAISEKLSKAWEHRQRKRIYKGCLQMKCKCGHEWVFSGQAQNGGTVCPKCKENVNKRHMIEIDSSSFKKCECGCGNPIAPSRDGKEIAYLQGHGPKGDILCKCGCGTLIHNPDEWGRYHDMILGHNSNLRGPEYFSAIATKMRSGPTAPERRVMGIVKKYKLPIRYGGMGKELHEWVGRFNPDFIGTNAPLVIDVQGDYFHNLEANVKRDERKKREMLKQGYVVLYLWEGELKKLSDMQIATKIKIALEEASNFSSRLALIFGEK